MDKRKLFIEKTKEILHKLFVVALLIFIYPVGMYFLWKNKKFDKVFKIIESICGFIVWILILLGLNTTLHKNQNNYYVEQETTTTVTQSTTRATTASTKPSLSTTRTTASATKKETTTTQPQTTTEAVPHRDGMYGVSDKNIKEISATSDFNVKSVNNDATGNWRVSTISNKDFDAVYYALSYYKRYFSNKNQIHAIINFYDKTTTQIQYMSGNLYVTIYDYVKGEEHDANLMFSGTVLRQYLIYPDNGDIELLS